MSNPLLARGKQNSCTEKSDGHAANRGPVCRFLAHLIKTLIEENSFQSMKNYHVSNGYWRELSETLLGGNADIRDNTFNS